MLQANARMCFERRHPVGPHWDADPTSLVNQNLKDRVKCPGHKKAFGLTIKKFADIICLQQHRKPWGCYD
jgi:hypothetical protein